MLEGVIIYGFFLGVFWGAMHEWNKKLTFLVFMTAAVAIIAITMLSDAGISGLSFGMTRWEFIAFIISSILGNMLGSTSYKQAFKKTR